MRKLLLSGLLLVSIFSFAQPVITSFFPRSGSIGSMVTINGNNFYPSTDSNIVFFGPVRAKVITASATTLSVLVPSGAGYSAISVTNNNGLSGYSSTKFIPTFSNSDDVLKSTLFSKKLEQVGFPSARAICIKDFDGNGIPDYLVAGQQNGISIIQSNYSGGVISFFEKNKLAADGEPVDAISEDLDGDGKPDLATVNIGVNKNSISVFKNTSTGSGSFLFENKIDYLIGHFCYRIYFADLDNDGKPDLLVSGSTDTISIFHNTSSVGNISFDPKSDLKIISQPNGDICLADLDGDGKPEIITSNLVGLITIYNNWSQKGDIAFNNAPQLITTSYGNTSSPIIADIDGDGKNDIVVLIQSLNLVTLLRNTTSDSVLTFDKKIEYGTGPNSNKINVSDLDGDGRPDLILINQNNQYTRDSLSYYRNTSAVGNINYAPRVAYSADQNLSTIALNDLDGDGKPDLLGGDIMKGKVSYLRNRISEPALVSITPDLVKTGDTITIKGNNLTGVNSVSFGGTSASSFNVNNDSTITAIIGNGSSGFVKVVSAYGTDSLGSIRYNVPVIDSVSPIAAAVGSTVTISGKNFSSNTADNIVYFGAVKALVTRGNSNSLTVQVPNGATYRPVSVTTKEGLIAKVS